MFKLIILLLSVIKLGLVSVQPLLAIHTSGHDDRLFLKLAAHLVQGEWLGPYNNLTLIKGPGYPLWLAVNYYLGLPLHLSQHLLYMLAGIVLLIPLRKLGVQTIFLLILYALYLFNPMIEVYVTRAGIYPALTVWVIAGLSGIYAYRESALIKLSLWAILTGLALIALWLTREEGIWLMPSTMLILGYTLWRLYQIYGFKLRLVLPLMPLIILWSGLQGVAAINQHYYGVDTLVELKSDAFLSAYGALSRVKADSWQRFVPLPRHVRQKIYPVSPAFKALAPFLEGRLGRVWAGGQDEIPGAIFVWALRDAVARAGYHRSAAQAQRYYARLAAEINHACAQQRLDCVAKRARFIPPPYQPEYVPLTIKALLFMTQSVINFKHLPPYKAQHHVACQLNPPLAQIVQGRWLAADCALPQASWFQSVHQGSVKLYQTVVPALIYMAIIFYVILVIHALGFRQISALFVINTALLVAILIRLVLVAIIDASAWPLIVDFELHTVKPSMSRYLLAIFPLLLIFTVLTFVHIGYSLSSSYRIYRTSGIAEF
ncbi:MAG: hypothetical protein SVR94_05220 [Pseudomonadota bacterium]|nr:hypothetical protein [Pseudomonadota bacterium]